MTAARRRRRRPWRWLVASLLLLAAMAYAQPEARAAYDRGAFAEAHDLARDVDTAAGQILAARAAIAHALYGGADEPAVREWLERALAAADRALALDPDRPDALLAKAQARGEIALRSSALGNLNVASDLRELLERALEVDPESPDAMVAVGMWHVQIAARGVGWLYGADPAAGLARVAAGVERAPRRIDLRIEYATALAAQGLHREAAEQLAIARDLPARNAFDRHQHARAADLQASWE